MKRYAGLLGLSFLWIAKSAQANPACVVCTVAVGASLSVARRLGISDCVVGLWLGAFLTLLGYWSIWWFDKKKWYFWGRDAILILLSLGLVMGVYIRDLDYTPQPIAYVLYLDPFLASVLGGSLLYLLSQKFYGFLKEKNGGHAHFPFEKVALPLLFLMVASGCLTWSI